MKYIRLTRRIFSMLSIRARESAVFVILIVLYASMEGFGIGLLLPVLEYVENGGGPVTAVGPLSGLIDLARSLGVPISLVTLLVMSFAPILVRQAVYYANAWYSATVQNRALENLTARAFSAVVHADLSFIESQDQGQLIGFLTGQTSRCAASLLVYLRLVGSLAVILVYVTVLSFISPELALFTVVAVIGVSASLRRILVSTRRYGTILSHATNATYAAIRERYAAIRLIKMRGLEDVETEHIRGLAAALRDAGVQIAMAAARVEVIVDPGLMLAVFVVVYVGVEAFDMSLASLGLFLLVLIRMNTKIKEVNQGRQQLASMLPSFDYVEETTRQAENVRSAVSGTRLFQGLCQGISFESVHFAYGDEAREVLSGVSCEIPRGALTAIVGRSGAGKSTMVDMIPRLRNPTSGVVKIDGFPVQDYRLDSLRCGIGLLTQEPILFNESVRSNLTYGLRESPTDDEIRRALDAAYCTEFVDDLPNGLETSIGDRGVRFSGGQRQRLALARVLLENPDILILDEPTSALDSESEQFIQQALMRLHGEKTLIVIAHRMSTVQQADQILVLESGRIVERGTHGELLVLNGAYRKLFDLQITVR